MANDGSVGGVGASSAGAAPMLEEQSESAVPDFDPGAQCGYMSSGEIMAWLAVVGGNTYDQMRQQMVGTEQRRELQKDLNDLKSLIEETKTTKDLTKLQAGVEELAAKYSETPFAGEIGEILGAHSDEFVEVAQRAEDFDDAKGLGKKTAAFIKLASSSEKFIAQLDSWSTGIQGEIDDLGTQDQLALIRIQELNSQITQSTQLASNILAAQDQAASTAIMNLKV
jgi:hypothetical protein